MNQYTFDLIAQHRPEVLERVLRVIRLRGFTVTNMDMALVETQVQLKITVKSDRTFDLVGESVGEVTGCDGNKIMKNICFYLYFLFYF